MLDHAKEAVDLIAGKNKEELQQDRVLELALIRLVEIVGEASVKVSSGTQAKIKSAVHIVQLRKLGTWYKRHSQLFNLIDSIIT